MGFSFLIWKWALQDIPLPTSYGLGENQIRLGLRNPNENSELQVITFVNMDNNWE